VWAFGEIELFPLERRGACVAALEATGIPACLGGKVGTKSGCWRFGGSGFAAGPEVTQACLRSSISKMLE
jgi:hypothetical protein